MWFKDLTGFKEESPEQVRNNLDLNGNILTSKINDSSWRCGALEMATLADLRKRVSAVDAVSAPLKVCELIGDAKALHADAGNAGAFFQVASQFNLLEMVGPDVTPEAGVGIYEYDRTQGPACAIAAGAGTIYRNYFVDVNGQTGQSSGNQIDCLQGVGKALGNQGQRLWQLKNGYVCASRKGLSEVSERLKSLTEGERDHLRQMLKIGIQWDTQVTWSSCEHLVSQAYCSALPVGYSQLPRILWKEFAVLVLEASYEAALSAAFLNSVRSRSNKVFLTLIGGGAFYNDIDWIISAMKRSIGLFSDSGLDIAVVSYGRSNPVVRELVESFSERRHDG